MSVRPEKSNFVVDVNKTYSDPNNIFEDLTVLDADKLFNHLIIASSFDKDVEIKFEGEINPNTILILANSKLIQDNFNYYGTIQWRYVSDAPTTGVFKMICY